VEAKPASASKSVLREKRHTSTAYLTMVGIGEDGEPREHRR
jgi:hypothetical protein